MHTKHLKKIFIVSVHLAIVSGLMFQVLGTAHAAPPGGTFGNAAVKLENPLKGANTVVEFVALVLTSIVLPIGAVLATLAIIYSGFLLVMARGNDKELPKAKRAFLYSVVGTAIILGAWGIAKAVENTINQITR